MPKIRIKYHPKTGEKIYEEVNGVVVLDKRYEPLGEAPMVMGDIKPYQSVIDGREITSRSRHREHLREHGCIEVGNEYVPVKEKPMPAVKPDLIDAYHRAREAARRR